MFSAIPAVTTLAVNSPAAQSSALETVSQGLRTNNAEQLESRSVAALQEGADSQKVDRKKEDEDRPKRQTQEKTTFQSQKHELSESERQIAQTNNRSYFSLDIMA
ncbi:MAG: hypothetical protein HQL72_01890 [Magnetococcales bacterium]|nr:hypothetical protein [Magnetococcales bacterium]